EEHKKHEPYKRWSSEEFQTEVVRSHLDLSRVPGASTMSNPQDIWNSYKDLLKKSYIERRFNAWRDLWADECRFVVMYGRAGNDGFEQEEHIGRDDIVSFFSGSSGKIEVDFRDDGPVYETKNEPATFVVISNFHAIIIAS